MAFTYTGDTFDDGTYTTVGDTGVGTLTVTGGIYARNSVVVGNQIGGVGTLSLLAGTEVNVGIFGFLVGWKGRGTTTISAGSIVNSTSDSYGNVEIGSHKGSVGNLTVTGANSQLNALSLNASVTVGAQGDGTLTVSNGGAVNVTGSNATLFVSGAWDVGLGLPTALLAQSELLITTGGVVTVTDTGAGYDTVNVGNEKFGNGAIRISGAGSKLVSIGTAQQDEIIIGNRGAGLLTIATGGEVEGRRMFVGNNLGGVGNLQISGVGSKLTLASDAVYGAPYSNAGLWVGNRGNGTMTVSTLATVGITGDRAQLHVGDGYGNAAAGAVGVLNIQSGGVVTVDHGPASYFNTTVFIGQSLHSVGTINVTGAGSKLVSIGSKDEITVGEQGKGTLNITAGGAVEGQRMFVGANFGGASLASVGTVIVDGVGSRITFASPDAYDPDQYQARIDVGRAGSGTMTVRNNATLSMTGARAELLIGNGEELLAAGPTGVMNIQSGGVVTVDHGIDPTAGFATVQLGANQFGTGTLNITGANSKLISLGNRDEILVGNYGKGTLSVTAGGAVEGQTMFVGTNETATGTVIVDGATSKITLASPGVYDANHRAAELTIGANGDGTMAVRAGASVNIAGARAHLFVGDGVELVAGGVGLLTIQSGGKMTVTNTDASNYFGAIDIGIQSGNGTVVVTGAGSTLTAAGTDPYITLGSSHGTGVLSVQAGGRVNSLGMGIGLGVGGIGTLNISGAGSKVVLSNYTFTPGIPGHDGETYAGFMAVGDHASSTGTLNITAGGVLEIRNSTDEVGPGLAIGNRQDSIGVVTVDGAGSAINIRQTGGVGPDYGPFIGVGNRGDGTLTVSNSAQINLTGNYGMFRVARGNDALDPLPPAEAPLSEAFILSGADVTINMSGGTGYGARVIIAQNGNSNGILTINGTGSTLNILGNNFNNTDSEKAQLIVAHEGEGELVIVNGADVFINGGDDKRPLLAIGLGTGSNGDLSITGAGSTLNLLTTNTSVDGGGLITVSRLAGSRGALNVSNGAQVINDLGSNNSVVTVAQASGSIGDVIVDGNGNVATLLDAGQLLVVGADWNELGATLGDVGFTGGGTGSVMVMDGATVRANNTAVGIGGTIGGNGKFDGNVTVDGGILTIGASPGILTVTGTLNVSSTTLDFEVKGLTAGTGYDQLKVTGAVTIVDVDINLSIDGTTFGFVDGNRILLIDGVAPLLVDINDVIVAPMLNVPATLAYSIADEGADLVFEALNNGLGLGTGLVSFGATSTIGATATINNGVVTGSGGRFNSVRSVGATGVEGTAGADVFTASGTQAVTLLGLAGNDVLTGTTAADTIDGGTGLDTVSYQNVAGPITVALNGALAATVGGAAAGDVIKNIENIIGTASVDTLTGDTLANVIDGGGGADIMAGGLGNDTYVVDILGDTITDTGGIDLVRSSITYSVAAAATLENLTLLAGFGNIDATGNALANILTGNEGNNRLNGGALADTMIGGLGNDTYVVDVATDKVTELAGGGTDSIETSLAIYSLAALAEVENLTYTGISAFTGTGNAKNNIIVGQSGADKLNGGLGADTLVGGLGNDTYIVDNAGDIVNETDGDGLDLVQSSVTFNLTADGIITFGIIDNLTLTGALAINGTGNAEANTIVGNTGANVIEGKGIAADILDGGAGLDTLSYASSGAGVTVTLNGATEVTQVSAGDAAGDKTKNFENIIGSAGIDILTGDTLANVIEGGAGADILDGKAGLDTLTYASSGAGVTVTLNGATEVTQAGAGDAAGDKTKNFENIIGSAHDDSLTGDGLANILTGGAGDDRLDGGVGVDTMIGGLGDDTYVVGIATDKVTELAGAGSGIDTIETSLATYSLNVAALLQVENLTYDNGVAVDVAFTGTGNALANTITGGAAADKLNGGLGADTLIGGVGADTLTGGTNNDLFVFKSFAIEDSGLDKITDFTGGAGIGDVVQIGADWGYADVAAVLADLQIVGADMVLDVDPNTSITFVGKAGLAFAADDFLII